MLLVSYKSAKEKPCKVKYNLKPSLNLRDKILSTKKAEKTQNKYKYKSTLNSNNFFIPTYNI